MGSKEEWRQVVGYEGLYSVSNQGNVKSDRFRTNSKIDRRLKPHKGQNGYYMVILYGKGKPKNICIHTLVSGAFLNKRPDGYDVDHIDNDRLNNYVENLRYVTRSKNIQRAFDQGRKFATYGENQPKSKLTENNIKEIRQLYGSGLHTQKKLGGIFNVGPDVISRIVNFKAWKHIT